MVALRLERNGGLRLRLNPPYELRAALVAADPILSPRQGAVNQPGGNPSQQNAYASR